MDALQQLLELEHSGWQSLCDGSGSDFYAGLMSDEALMILADRVTMTRDEVAEALRYAPPWASFIIEDPHVLSVKSTSSQPHSLSAGDPSAGTLEDLDCPGPAINPDVVASLDSCSQPCRIGYRG